MSHYMTALAMRQKGLKPAAKLVLYWLADHHNSETGLCCPSIATLARECEISDSSVSRHLKDLEDMGIIERVSRVRENGSQTSTSYKLSIKQAAPNSGTPCPKMGQPPAPKCHPHNLGNNNLGNEPIEADASLSLVPTDSGLDEISQAVLLFKEAATANGWPIPTILSKARRTSLKNRLSECGGIEGWKVALDKAQASGHCNGKNDRGWVCNFDFLVRQSSFAKLMEGNYDDRPSTNSAKSANRNTDVEQITFAGKFNRASDDDCF